VPSSRRTDSLPFTCAGLTPLLVREPRLAPIHNVLNTPFWRDLRPASGALRARRRGRAGGAGRKTRSKGDIILSAASSGYGLLRVFGELTPSSLLLGCFIPVTKP
jgi:hypothetical protein